MALAGIRSQLPWALGAAALLLGMLTGTQALALPYVLHAGLSDSMQLIQDIEGDGPPFGKVTSISSA